jgi:hypothetical protein
VRGRWGARLSAEVEEGLLLFLVGDGLTFVVLGATEPVRSESGVVGVWGLGDAVVTGAGAALCAVGEPA